MLYIYIYIYYIYIPVLVYIILYYHYPKYDDNVCSKLFLSREQNNFRSCCP